MFKIARESDGDKKIETDLVGRVMLLEQKYRSISGRINALEMRITGGAAEAYDWVPDDDVEFVPADGGQDSVVADVIRMQGRVAALEKALEKPSKKPAMIITAGKFSFDVTGLIVGFLLLAGGALVAMGNWDLLKNPVLFLAGGIVILTWVAYKAMSR